MAAAYSEELADWRKSMAYLLDTNFDSALFLPIFLRQRNVLNLAFWHVRILLHRPFLLNSFASLTNYSVNRSIKSTHATEVAHNVQLCLDAASQIIRLVDEINNAGQLYHTFWVRYQSESTFKANGLVYTLLCLLRRCRRLRLRHTASWIIA